jgi:hypothetical protein
MDRLTSVLTRTGSDLQFRERCLTSPESAKKAVSEVGGIEFPPDFQVKFVTPEEQLRNLVLAVPDFIPAENGSAEVRQAEDFQLCSYRTWRS